MKGDKDTLRIIPTFSIILTLLGLFGLVIFFYTFYKSELNQAIYKSVLTQAKNRLRYTTSSYELLLKKERTLNLEDSKEEIKEEVKNAWVIANSIYHFCKKRRCRDETIKLLIKNALQNYKFFNGLGYIFIDKVKGKVVLNPAYPQIEGKSMWNWKDLKGKFVHREFERIVLYSPNGEGFITYYWYKPNSKEVDKKISYIKLFKPYNWIIGGGVYYSQIRERIKRHAFCVGKAINAFIYDPSSQKEKPDILKGLKPEDLRKGVFVYTKDRLYYLKLYPEWNWIVGSYISKSEMVKDTFYLQKEFLTKADKIIVSTSAIILLIITLSSFALFSYNRKLAESIKELKEKEGKLVKLTRNLKIIAYKDDITGLPNSKKLIEDLSKIDPSKNIHFALINIRNFKELNELFGFDDGNKILKAFAQNLKREVKKLCKNCIIYRIRGNKFGVLSCNLNDTQFIELIEKIIQKLENHEFEVNNIKFKLDVIAGISKNRDNPLIEAEMAEEEAKKRDFKLYVFDKELENKFKKLEENLKIAILLKDALEKDKVIPFFQPIVELKSLKVVKYEAVMRVETPEGILNPGQFLEVAKKMSIYKKLSKSVLEKAFKKCAETGIDISVNLSTEDLASENMVNWIISRLEEYKIAEKVCFEVVETEAFSDLKILENFYRRIKDIGALLAIDDFGSGYSNYEYLATVKPDIVKIDGSLISKISSSKEVEKLVRHIVTFCKDLQIKTVAEFISSKELYEKAKEIGIDYGQGYYFGKPSPEIKSELEV